MKNYFWLVLIIFSCANPVPPTGGPKDLDPPILLNTIPENKSLNFNGSEISLEFDEYIKEENLLTQLMITPNLKGNYTYRVNRTQIIIRFDTPFDSVTTYTLNFREGIKDITEGNVPPNLKFVFSTGDYLDSASIRGTVRALLSKKLLEDITISLYKYPDTISIFDAPPRYSTITDEEGIFLIENIKNGNYSIFSLNDENRNLTLESRSEGYGFLEKSMEITDSIPSFEMFVFNLDTRPIVLQNSRPVGSNYDIKFNKAISSYRIITEIQDLQSNLVEEQETLRIYRNESITDSLGMQFVVYDSLQQSLDTLVYVKFEESTRKPEEFTATLTPANSEVNKEWKGSLEFNKPISSINYDSIYFRFDSLYTLPLTETNFTPNYSKDHYRLNFNFRSYLTEDSIFSNWNAPFELVISKGSILSVENDSIKSMTREYSFKDPKDYGILRGTIRTDQQTYFLQLIDQSFEVLEEQYIRASEPFSYEFNHIEPGTYSIRILVDENSNGTWDAGNILLNQLPEKVHLFFHPNVESEEIKLRANWEQAGLDLAF